MNRIKSSKEKISNFLLQSTDFYLEMKWEFDSFIPFLSTIAPSDTLKIWKISNNIRADSTFDDFKKLKTERIPMSIILTRKEEKSEIFKINHNTKTYFDPLEPLDDEEKILIINDLLNSQKIKGEFRIKKCEIVESKSIFGNLQYDIIDGWKAKKYDVLISTCVSIYNRENFEFKLLEKQSYFDEKSSLIYSKIVSSNDKDIKTTISDNVIKLDNEILKKSLMNIKKENDKKLKASVWIADNFPLKSSSLINLINSISSANDFLVKVKEFLSQENVKKILETNGFPVKIKIPLTFYLDIEITFSHFLDIDSVEKDKLFEIPSDYLKISRKDGQNIKESHKKRLVYANFAI